VTLYALIASLGIGALYAETAFAHSGSPGTAAAAGGLAFAGLAISFLAPALLFKYSNADAAPRVMTQVISRALVASVVVLAVQVLTWVIITPRDVALLEELYVFALIVILLFHGLGGAVASHVVYLQQTHQYNSNQLLLVLVLVTLLLLILVLYFLAFDFAIARDAHIHLRDMMAVTLVLMSYGRAIYLMAHH
jgi:hypothetical protein